MTDAQAWTLILGSLTVSFTLVGFITSGFNRVLRAEIGSVRHEIGSVRHEIGSVRHEIGSVRNEVMTEMRSGFKRVDERIDLLDRDVQALTRHVFRQE